MVMIAHLDFHFMRPAEDGEPKIHGLAPLSPITRHLPSANGRKVGAAILIVAERPRTDLAPAMAGQGKQVDADHQRGVQSRGASQGPAAQGSFLALHLKGMAGRGGASGLIYLADRLLLGLIRLPGFKVGVRFLPDGDGSRPAEQAKGDASQAQECPRFGFPERNAQ
jgi:hypothetical protein